MSPFSRFLPIRRTPKSAQVIGICRFSYPALGGFKRAHETPQDRARYLYGADRLDQRFALFEAFTLPSLRAQTDPDFTFLMVVGQDFPPERMAQLRVLTHDMPQVVIQAHAPGNHRAVMKAAINSVRRKGAWSIQFRHDDDDAVGVSFVAELRRMLDEHFALFQRNRHGVIDFTQGYNCRADAQGIHAEPDQQLFLGVAYAMVIRPDVALSVMNFNHHEAWMHMPTITRNDPDMWVRGVNDHNDSGDPIGRRAVLLTPQQETLFQRAFGISAASVRAICARQAVRGTR